MNTDGALNVLLDANTIGGKLHIPCPPLREPTGAASHAATENSTENSTDGATAVAMASATSSRSRIDAATHPTGTKRGGR